MSARSQQPGAWFEIASAAVPAAAAAWSAALLAPLFDMRGELASPLAGIVLFFAGWGLMRAASPRAAEFELRVFRPPAEPDEHCEDPAADEQADTLLLDRPLAGSMDALAELLLDDPLPEPSPHSRVIQLFPAQPLPTAGELMRRIDRHLASESEMDVGPPGVGEAADTLRQALDELRHSLTRR